MWSERNEGEQHDDLGPDSQPIPTAVVDDGKKAWTMAETRVMFEAHRYCNGMFRAQIFTGERGGRFAQTARFMQKYNYVRSADACRRRYKWVLGQCRSEEQQMKSSRTALNMEDTEYYKLFREFLDLEREIHGATYRFVADNRPTLSGKINSDVERQTEGNCTKRTADSVTETNLVGATGIEQLTSVDSQQHVQHKPKETLHLWHSDRNADILVQDRRSKFLGSQFHVIDGEVDGKRMRTLIETKPEFDNDRRSIRGLKTGDVVGFRKECLQAYSEDRVLGRQMLAALVLRYSGSVLDVITSENQVIRHVPRIGAVGFVRNLKSFRGLDAVGQLFQIGDVLEKPDGHKKASRFRVLFCNQTYAFVTPVAKKRIDIRCFLTTEMRLVNGDGSVTLRSDEALPSMSRVPGSFSNAELKYWARQERERSSQQLPSDRLRWCAHVAKHSAVSYLNDTWFCLSTPGDDGHGSFMSSRGEQKSIDVRELKDEIIGEADVDRTDRSIRIGHNVSYMKNGSKWLGTIQNIAHGYCLLKIITAGSDSKYEVMQCRNVVLCTTAVIKLGNDLRQERSDHSKLDKEKNTIPKKTGAMLTVEEILASAAEQQEIDKQRPPTILRQSGPQYNRRQMNVVNVRVPMVSKRPYSRPKRQVNKTAIEIEREDMRRSRADHLAARLAMGQRLFDATHAKKTLPPWNLELGAEETVGSQESTADENDTLDGEITPQETLAPDLSVDPDVIFQADSEEDGDPYDQAKGNQFGSTNEYADDWRKDADFASDLNSSRHITVTRRMMLLIDALRKDLDTDSRRGEIAMNRLREDTLSVARQMMAAVSARTARASDALASDGGCAASHTETRQEEIARLRIQMSSIEKRIAEINDNT